MIGNTNSGISWHSRVPGAVCDGALQKQANHVKLFSVGNTIPSMPNQEKCILLSDNDNVNAQ